MEFRRPGGSFTSDKARPTRRHDEQAAPALSERPPAKSNQGTGPAHARSLIGLSVDPVDSHGRWLADIEETQGAKVNYPIIADHDLKVAKLYNMLPAEEPGTSEGRTAATNQTVRSVFVVGPDKKIKLMLTYPMTTGRNFDEILRVIDSMQLTAKHKVATPANWKHGDDVIIAGSVSDDDAKKLFPAGWQSPKPYIRIVKQPG
jgi:alkyl hydroperoxide reductase subunit AhpC